jgi:hypothetical protein
MPWVLGNNHCSILTVVRLNISQVEAMEAKEAEERQLKEGLRRLSLETIKVGDLTRNSQSRSACTACCILMSFTP